MVAKKILFLDSDILIPLLHDTIDFNKIKAQFSQFSYIATTTANVYEIYFGFFHLKYSKKKVKQSTIFAEERALQNLISKLIIVDMNLESSIRAADIYHQLKAKGQGIDAFDCMVAGILLTSNSPSLLTGNESHFQRIPGLEIFTI